MKFIVLIRYNVAIRHQSGKTPLTWKIGRDTNFANYCSSLFAPERLKAHETLLLQLTIPSLIGQSLSADSHNLHALIFTSSLLPRANQQILYEATKPYKWIEIIQVRPDSPPDFSIHVRRLIMSNRPAQASTSEAFATIRLDDDDGLSRTYLENLSHFVRPELSGMAVSFPRGYMANYNPHASKICECIECDHYKNAQGLALINEIDYNDGSFRSAPATVFDLGNHLKADQVVPVICDARHHAYLRIFHADSDSYSKKHRDNAYKEARLVAVERVRQSISFSEELA